MSRFFGYQGQRETKSIVTTGLTELVTIGVNALISAALTVAVAAGGVVMVAIWALRRANGQHYVTDPLYGGVLDSQSAATANLASLSAAMAAASLATSGEVIVPGLLYVAPSSTTVYSLVKSNVTLAGHGPSSVIKVKDNAGDYAKIFADNGVTVTNFHVRDLTIDQNATGNTTSNVSALTAGALQIAFHFTGVGSSNITFDRVRFDPCTGVNTINTGQGTKNFAVRDCTFNFDLSANAPLAGHDATNAYLEGKGGFVVTGNHFYSEAYADRGASAVEFHCQNAVCSGNVVDRRIVGFHVVPPFNLSDQDEQSNITITGNTIARGACGVLVLCATTASNAAPVVRNVTIAGNTIGLATLAAGHDSNSGFGIDVRATAGTVDGITIAANTIRFELDTRLTSTVHGGATLDGNGVWAGIRCNASLTGVIQNVQATGNTVINAPWFGMYAGGTLSRVAYRGNRLVDSGTMANASSLRSGLEITGTLTDCDFEGNKIEDTATGGTPVGLTAWRVYPTVAPVRSTFRRNRISVAGSGTLQTVFQDAVAFIGGPDDDSETLTYAATITPSPWRGTTKYIPMNGNLIIGAQAIAGFSSANFATKGCRLRLVFTQDPTGGRTHSFNALYKTNWTPDTAPNKVNVWEGEFNGTNWIQTNTATGL